MAPSPDPLLDLLANTLPYPLYATAENFILNVYTIHKALESAFAWGLLHFGLGPAADSTETNAGLNLVHNILPSLLSIFAIYFTLMTIYRTTMSVLRTIIFILKWGTIIGVLAYFAGAAGRGGSSEEQGEGAAAVAAAAGGIGQIFSAVGSLVGVGGLARLAGQFVVTGRDEFSKDGTRKASRGGRQTSGQGEGEGDRPSVFDSFVDQDAWRRAQENQQDPQEYIEEIFDAGSKVYKEGQGFMNVLFGGRRRSAEKVGSNEKESNDRVDDE